MDDAGERIEVLVLDDGRLARRLRDGPAAPSLEIRTPSAPDGMTEVVRRPPQLVLLQFERGHVAAGLEVVARLREVTTVGTIVAGATGRVEERISSLDAGADDHVGPAFDHGELLARMRAVLRRTAPPPEPLLITGDGEPLVIDLDRHEVRLGGKPLRLTGTELRLLELLAGNPGRLLTRRQLLARIWGEQYSSELHYLRVYVAQLRKKLGDPASAPRLIETVPGLGYRWIGTVRPAPSTAAPSTPERLTAGEPTPA
jgi:two-component system, OmpR family, KDP operon response regulator KdpE